MSHAVVGGGMGEVDLTPEKVVWDQYRVWKHQSAGLYDFLAVHPLEWPALSLDWLPEDDCRDQFGYSLNYLLMGTYAFQRPDEGHTFEDVGNGANGNARAKKRGGGENKNHIYNLEVVLPSVSDYYSQFGQKKHIGTIAPKQKLAHEGEVNCIKHMPQNPHVIASRGPARGSSAPVSIYYLDNAADMTGAQGGGSNAQSSALGGSGQIDPALYLNLAGHRAEGVTLSWNKQQEGTLASGADDGQVLVWDLEDHVQGVSLAAFERGETRGGGKGINPQHTLQGHEAEVQGVDFHPLHQHLLFSVSDDRTMRIWDTRVAHKGSVTNVRNAHNGAINCVQAHPYAEHVVATAGRDVVKIWDIRFERRSEPTLSLRGHAGEVTCMEWATFSETVIATGSADRTVIVWDIAKSAMKSGYTSGKIDCCPWIQDTWLGEYIYPPPPPPRPVDDLHIPKEIMFVHFGHTAPITALSWNPNEDGVLATASQDNMLHVWKIGKNLREMTEEEAEVDELVAELDPTQQAARDREQAAIQADEELEEWTYQLSPSEVADNNAAGARRTSQAGPSSNASANGHTSTVAATPPTAEVSIPMDDFSNVPSGDGSGPANNHAGSASRLPLAPFSNAPPPPPPEAQGNAAPAPAPAAPSAPPPPGTDNHTGAQ